jgi:hypothetical protein
MKPLRNSIYFLLLLTLLLTACAGEPTPYTPEILARINCQPGDFPGSPRAYIPIENKPPPDTIFAGGAPLVSASAAFNDIESTRQSFACSLYIFEDAATALGGFESACNEVRPPFRFPNIGEQACQGTAREREVILVVLDKTALIWIWADTNGEGIDTVANRILDRLNK